MTTFRREWWREREYGGEVEECEWGGFERVDGEGIPLVVVQGCDIGITEDWEGGEIDRGKGRCSLFVCGRESTDATVWIADWLTRGRHEGRIG
jgi:hypothetical protein